MTASNIPTTTLPEEISTPSIHNSKQTSSDGPTIQPWVIAAVVLACLAVLGACLAIIWVMRQSRKRKLVHGETGKNHITVQIKHQLIRKKNRFD
jgi:uncharacterized protein (DUF2062 family)